MADPAKLLRMSVVNAFIIVVVIVVIVVIVVVVVIYCKIGSTSILQ